MSTLLYNSATDIKVERDYLANLQTPPPMESAMRRIRSIPLRPIPWTQ